MADAFSNRMRSPADPAITIFPISPNDTADLPAVTTALSVATPGAVRVTMVDGSEGTVTIHPGQAFPIRVRRVWLSGTTATGLQGLV